MFMGRGISFRQGGCIVAALSFGNQDAEFLARLCAFGQWEEINLGHDLYIQARIKEKRTGRVITCGDSDDYAAEDSKGFFDICWWCGSPECDVRIGMIEICNRHGGTGYTDADLFIPIPLSALRDSYAHVVSCCCFPEDINLPYETE